MDKQCTMCGQNKPLTEYYADPRGKHETQARCKSCCYKVTHAYSQLPKAKAARQRWLLTARGRSCMRAGQRRYAASPQGKFTKRRRNAEARGIQWNFTFEEWFSIMATYLDRPNISMGRFMDTGPYERGNVYITTVANNTADARRWEKL